MTLEAAGPLEAGDWRSVVAVLEAAGGGSCQFNQPNMDSAGMCSDGGGLYTWDTPDSLPPPPSQPLNFWKITSLGCFLVGRELT